MPMFHNQKEPTIENDLGKNTIIVYIIGNLFDFCPLLVVHLKYTICPHLWAPNGSGTINPSGGPFEGKVLLWRLQHKIMNLVGGQARLQGILTL